MNYFFSRIKEISSFIVLFIFIFSNITAQRFVNIDSAIRACTIDGNAYKTPYYADDASEEVKQIFTKICKLAGTDPSKIIIESANINKAYTYRDRLGVRYIHYSTEYIDSIKRITPYAVHYILAHEIGHHFYGESFEKSDLIQIKINELRADKFAGCRLANLGVNPDDIAKIVSILSETGDTNHPEKSARQNSIKAGFNNCTKISDIEPRAYDPNMRGNIEFKNTKKTKIRITQVLDSDWIDTQKRIIIEPNQSSGFTNLPNNYMDFYIEIFGGKDEWGEKWQYYQKINRRVHGTSDKIALFEIE
jgi:hypothetical protein